MDSKCMSQWAYSAASCKVRNGPSPSPRLERDAALQLNRGETLILVLLLSLGLWALIWGVVSLLAACELR